MADETTTTTDNTTTTTTTEAEKPKLVPVGEVVAERQKRQALEAKLKTYEEAEETRKTAEMGELEREKAEKAKLEERVRVYEIGEAKTAALRKAKTKILGDSFTLDGVEEAVEKAIGKLSYDPDTILDDVSTIIDLAKKPKTQSTKLGKMPASTESDNKPATKKSAVTSLGERMQSILNK